MAYSDTTYVIELHLVSLFYRPGTCQWLICIPTYSNSWHTKAIHMISIKTQDMHVHLSTSTCFIIIC